MNKDLFERIRCGDIKAFEQLYSTYYGLMCSFAFNILHNRHIAEEITDDVFYNIWKLREEIDIDELRGYIIRSIRNRSLNELKKPTYRNKNSTDYITDKESAEFIQNVFSDTSQPLGTLLQKELEAHIQHALTTLSPETLRVFELSRFEHKKNKEIADELGISVNTVKYHIKTAMKKLREELSKYMLLLLFI